eukprot:scaffold683_cov124-Cylindrotheca_fusiformis.AAC.10
MKKGESQRIYWQQWLSPNGANGGNSRRELITSSAAIRISPDAAKAKDVTRLLRKTLNLSSLSNQRENAAASDALVLVGTLYSLPHDYVQFEHTAPAKSQQDASASMTVIASCQSDPFHVVKTLEPEENPLATRDKMMDHLRRLQEGAPAVRTIISPKLQWYFVPSSQPSTPPSPIPSCIELDGYCTSMEEEEYASDEEDEDPYHSSQPNGETDETLSADDSIFSNDEPETLISKTLLSIDMSQLNEEETPFREVHTSAMEEQQHAETVKQLRRFIQLTQSQSTATSRVSGYLLKQSHVDRHVWRRVHCVLTDDHLWYVTRIPYAPNKTFPRVAKKHGRISLGQTLLLEPNTDFSTSPTYRIPNSFEVVSPRGTSHVFRAPSRALQLHWIQAISIKIMESYENSLMSHAELIVADESIARNRRLAQTAVSPLCSEIESESFVGEKSISGVLRLGMDISEYREQCRHIQASFPAKSPVVVISESSNPTRAREMDNAISDRGLDPIDAKTKQLVQATWDMASTLLSKATNVAMDIQQSTDAKQISRSLEVLCRHVDYVITGQHRQVMAEGGLEENGNGTRNREPPPIDLFDLLLSELQSLVGSTTMSC